MGKGAFRGSLHFCGQARQSARTRSKRPFPASRRRGSGNSTRISRLRPGRSPAFGPADTRIGIRLPSRLPDKQTHALSGRHAPGSRLTGTLPGHPCLPTTRPGRGRTPSGPDRANMLPCLPDLPAPRHDHGHDRGRGFPPAGGCGPGLRYRVPDMQKIRSAGPRTKARAARKRAETAHTYLYPFAVQILKSLTCFGSRA